MPVSAGGSAARAVGLAALAAAVVTGCGGADDPAGPRPDLIVPGASVDRVAVGMDESQVEAALGRPARIGSGSQGHTGIPIRTWIYDGHRLEVSIEGDPGDGRVMEVATRSPAHRTREGARVGTSEASLRMALEGVECGRGGSPGTRWCTLGGSSEGDVQTVFEVRRDRVSAVWVTKVF